MVSTHDYIGDVTEGQKKACEVVREKAKDLEGVIQALKDSTASDFCDRKYEQALEALETCCMFAIKAVVFEHENVGEDDETVTQPLSA